MSMTHWLKNFEPAERLLRSLNADTREDRAAVRAAVEAGRVHRAPVSATIVCAMLDLAPEELDAMFSLCPVDGYTAAGVDAALRQRFNIDDDATLPEALEGLGILTPDEVAWLRDS